MAASPDGDLISRPHQRVALLGLKLFELAAPGSAGIHHAVIASTPKVANIRGKSGPELRPIELPVVIIAQTIRANLLAMRWRRPWLDAVQARLRSSRPQPGACLWVRTTLRAPMTSRCLKKGCPCFAIRPSRSFPPVEFCLGVRSCQAANSRPERNMVSSGRLRREPRPLWDRSRASRTATSTSDLLAGSERARGRWLRLAAPIPSVRSQGRCDAAWAGNISYLVIQQVHRTIHPLSAAALCPRLRPASVAPLPTKSNCQGELRTG